VRIECEFCGVTIAYYDGDGYIPRYSFQCPDCHANPPRWESLMPVSPPKEPKP